MFLGEYQHSLDAKGRLILPSRFRAQLESGLTITRGLDRCIWVLPTATWTTWTEKLGEQLGVGDPRARDFARFLFSGAHEDHPDKQGRISIPDSLRRHAALERDVTTIGNGRWVEIWNRERWEASLVEQQARMAENLADLGL